MEMAGKIYACQYVRAKLVQTHETILVGISDIPMTEHMTLGFQCSLTRWGCDVRGVQRWKFSTSFSRRKMQKISTGFAFGIINDMN